MSYTHYYGFKNAIPCIISKAVMDIHEIIKKYEGLLQQEYNRAVPPVCKPNLIYLNGKGELGHESLNITPGRYYKSCKTDRKPYDLPVCEILLVLKHYYREEFHLSSDGFWVNEEDADNGTCDGNWNEALQNIEEKFGYKYVLTPEMSKSNGVAYYNSILKAL